MPGLDGPALLKAARPYLGAAPVMFISGYAQSEFSDLLEGEAGVSFLPKPLSLPTLAERVKQRLTGA
jgi:two-component system cell cycle sensor histidine kinase/response regulator CckA